VVLEGIAPGQGAALLADALGRGGGWLAPGDVAALLGCYGLSLSEGEPAVADGYAAVELVVGVVNDRNFGPVLACSPGGAAGELVHDVAVRLTPLSSLDAHELPRALQTFPLLDGYRGRPRCDVPSLERMLLRISAMVEHHPEIVELECDPVHVSPGGTAIGGARIRLEATTPPPPLPSLRSY
jgi:hypothetical protein